MHSEQTERRVKTWSVEFSFVLFESFEKHLLRLYNSPEPHEGLKVENPTTRDVTFQDGIYFFFLFFLGHPRTNFISSWRRIHEAARPRCRAK